jgi:K(+)-stimulated pyrophosphate-energized sodium pump
MTVVLYAILPAILAILYGVVLIGWINKQPSGDDRMKAIAKAIQEGANAYLGRQYKTIAIVATAVFVLIAAKINLITGLGFLTGAGTFRSCRCYWYECLRTSQYKNC